MLSTSTSIGASLLRSAAIAFVTIVAATGCGADGGSETAVPPPHRLVAEGKTLYQANCASCHGSDLRGTDKGPSHLSVVYEPSHHGDESFIVAIRVGTRSHHWDFGDMAPVDGLTDDDIAAIIAFVRESQRVSGFEPYPP